jgi:hypothetical protein
MILGFVIGVGAMGGIGFAMFFPTHPSFPYPPPTPARRHWIPIIGFFGTSILAVALAVYIWRKKPESRWFLLGLLFGVAITGLLEGACFMPLS